MLKKILATVLVAFALQGCMAFIAGAAIGGVVVYEGRNWQQQTVDKRITSEAEKKLNADEQLHNTSRIIVSGYNGDLLVAGQTPDPALKQRAEEHLRSIPGVKRIYNEITIGGPISTLTESSDAWVTTKIKTQMLADTHLKSSSIKVITENGTVFLMGIVTKEQGRIASDIARESSGVQRVVTLFSYKADGANRKD